MFTPGKQITVGRTRVALIGDDIGGDRPPRGVVKPLRLQQVPGTDRYIWISETALQSARSTAKGLPVYGVWQLLLTGGKLTGDDAFYGYELSSTQWAYLHVVRGKPISSGRGVDNIIPDLGVHKSDVTMLNVDDPAWLAGCSIPHAVARLPDEIQAVQLGEARKRKFVSIGAVAAAVVALFGIDFTHKLNNDAQQAELARLHQSLAQAELEFAATALNYSPVTELDKARQTRLIDRMVQGLTYFSLGDLGQELVFWGQSEITLEIVRFIPGVTYPVELLVTEDRRVGLRFSIERDYEIAQTAMTNTLSNPDMQTPLQGGAQ